MPLIRRLPWAIASLISTCLFFPLWMLIAFVVLAASKVNPSPLGPSWYHLGVLVESLPIALLGSSVLAFGLAASHRPLAMASVAAAITLLLSMGAATLLWFQTL